MATMVLLIAQSTIQSARIVEPMLDADALAARTRPLAERISDVIPDPTALNAARRTADLTALAEGEPLDVVVIGGGITGAGIALDAASRGLRGGAGGKARLGVRHQPLEFQARSTAACATWRPATWVSPVAAPSSAES